MAIRINGLLHRQAEAQDVAAIRAFARAAYADWVTILGREPLPMTADYQKAQKIHCFDLFCQDEKICALLETDIREDSLWIENIAVAPALHGQGIGQSLLDFAQGIATKAKRNHITLCTNAKMTRNIGIYQKYGFKIDREEVVSHGTVTYMSMQIAA